MSSAASTVVDVDVAHESSARVVWTLAWPAVLLNSFQVINSLLDRGFVGHLESSSIMAHSASMNIIFMMISLSMTIATSATALVSRAFGAGNPAEYRAASSQCLKVGFLAGLGFLGLTIAIAPFAAANLLPADQIQAAHQMRSFLIAFAIGMPAFFIIQSLAGSLRGVGDTKSPMVISGLQIVMHMLLNFLLIFPPKQIGGGIVLPGFDLGLLGAGVALATSAWISALVYLIYMARTPLGDMRSFSLPGWSWTLRILRIASPAALMALLRVSSLTALTLIIKNVPDGGNAIAAMGIAFSLEGIMFMPAFGFSVAAAALVGQSLGMRRPDRAERLGWTASHMAAAVVLCLVLPIYFGSHGIALVMTDGKEAIAAHASELLRYLCVTEVMFAYAMVTIGALQGAGDTVRPMWITIVAQWLLRVPLAYAFGVIFSMGAMGVWLSFAISQAVQGAMAMGAFKLGAWKLKEV